MSKKNNIPMYGIDINPLRDEDSHTFNIYKIDDDNKENKSLLSNQLCKIIYNLEKFGIDVNKMIVDKNNFKILFKLNQSDNPSDLADVVASQYPNLHFIRFNKCITANDSEDKLYELILCNWPLIHEIANTIMKINMINVFFDITHELKVHRKYIESMLRYKKKSDKKYSKTCKNCKRKKCSKKKKD